MARYHAPVAATRINLIAPPDKKKQAACRRCGEEFYDVRDTTTHCTTCRAVMAFEERMAEAGIDLASLADDEFVVRRKVDGEYQWVVIKEVKRLVA